MIALHSVTSESSRGIEATVLWNSSPSPHVGISLNWISAPGDGVSQRFSDRKAVSSQSNAGLEQVLPGQPAMPPVGHLVTTDLPGNSYGQSTCGNNTAIIF